MQSNSFGSVIELLSESVFCLRYGELILLLANIFSLGRWERSEGEERLHHATAAGLLLYLCRD